MKMAFLFPGQGSQYVGMGKDLYHEFPVVRQTFEEASDAVQLNFKKICFDSSKSDLTLTANTQPAVLLVSIAVLRVLKQESDLSPAVVAGHSLGEYSALVAASAFSFPDAVRVVRYRGQFMQEAVPHGEGAMAALFGLNSDQIQQLCDEVCKSLPGKVLAPANFNGGGQIVIAGHVSAVEAAIERAPILGASRAVKLPVSAPFHCPLMKPAAVKLAEVLEEIKIGALVTPYIANYDAKPHTEGDKIREFLALQVDHPVRWGESMTYCLEDGVEKFFELGPGRVLTGLLRRIKKDSIVVNIEDVSSLRKTLT